MVRRDARGASVEGCLAGGGEMGALMRSLDWSKTPLGPVSGWPTSLKTMAGVVLNNRFPMLLWWGPELIQAVYNEGAYVCPAHGCFYGQTRPIAQLRAGDYAMHCPVCGAIATPAPTDEGAPMGGENVYAISKADQERVLISWGRATGRPVVALRYSCTYGPRQSIFNPYTGVIAIFCTRLVNDLEPVVYEDGHQSRDLIFVQDVARANMLAATDDRANGRIFNVGTGQAVEIADLARMLADRLGKPIEPYLPGTFRPGEMRALISDITSIAELGFQPAVDLSTGIDRYLDWIGQQGEIAEYFSAAEQALRRRSIVKESVRR